MVDGHKKVQKTGAKGKGGRKKRQGTNGRQSANTAAAESELPWGVGTDDEVERAGIERKRKVQNRMTRARLRTRRKLINAARRVMSHKGIDNATIAEITETADVGFGSFYNHFKSKEEISAAVFEACLDDVMDVRELILEDVEDIALAISFIEQAIFEKARRDPIWGWFIIRAETALQQMHSNWGDKAHSDIEKGVKGGRFDIKSIDTAVDVVLAALLGTMRAQLEGRATVNAGAETCEMVLRMLGVEPREAGQLAATPLPEKYLAQL